MGGRGGLLGPVFTGLFSLPGGTGRPLLQAVPDLQPELRGVGQPWALHPDLAVAPALQPARYLAPRPLRLREAVFLAALSVGGHPYTQRERRWAVWGCLWVTGAQPAGDVGRAPSRAGGGCRGSGFTGWAEGLCSETQGRAERPEPGRWRNVSVDEVSGNKVAQMPGDQRPLVPSSRRSGKVSA